jgi:hypothetical protein
MCLSQALAGEVEFWFRDVSIPGTPSGWVSCHLSMKITYIFQGRLVWVSISQDRLIRESCYLDLRPTILYGSVPALRPDPFQMSQWEWDYSQHLPFVSSLFRSPSWNLIFFFLFIFPSLVAHAWPAWVSARVSQVRVSVEKQKKNKIVLWIFDHFPIYYYYLA